MCVEPVDRRAFDHVVREQHPVGIDRCDGAEVRSLYAGITRFQREQRLVFDAATQRRERPLVAHVLQPDTAVVPEHQVGVALVASEGLDEQASAVGRGREPRRRAPRVYGRRREVTDCEPALGERRDDVVTGGAVNRRPEREEHDRPTRPADRDRDRKVDGHLSTGSDAQCDDDADEEPRNMAPPASERGAAHDGEAGSDRDVDLVGEAGFDDPSVGVLGGVERGRVTVVDQLLGTPDREPREGGAGRGNEKPAVLPHDEEAANDDERVEERDELRQADEDPFERIRQLVEEGQDVGFEPDQRVAVEEGYEQRRKQQRERAHQRQHVDG